MTRRAVRFTTAIAVGLLAVSLGTSHGWAADPEIAFEHGGDPVYRVLPPGKIPAILSPEFVSGAKADAQMAAEEPVLALVIGKEAKTYSLWQLDAHEIVNDRIAGRPIAVSW